MITCTRRLEADIAHRVLNHESKCAHLHGHRYVFEITAVLPTVSGLDPIGRVIDFSVLKEKVGGWIDREWDHNTLVYENDIAMICAFNALQRHSGNRDPFLTEFNPTAENIADHLLRVVCPRVLADTGVTVTKVKVYETPNGIAEATL